MEIVVLSGKGGTGKTTVAMALGHFFKEAGMIDCDVDAPNLEMFFNGNTLLKEDFYGEKKAVVNLEKCIQCGMCTEYCKFEAIDNGKVKESKCEGCGVCKIVCPSGAVQLEDVRNAEVFIDDSNSKMITRAEMEVGSEGSGKLITRLRKFSGDNTDTEITIIDGSPGIGCPVISSSTNCNAALVVSEPTLSGLSDLIRICETTKGLGVKTYVCINKYDINEEMTEKIREYCQFNNIDMIGVIPFDKTVMKGINSCKSITEYPESSAYIGIESIWKELNQKLNEEKITRRNIL